MGVIARVAKHVIQTIAEPVLIKVGEAIGELVAGKINPNYSGLVREDEAEEEQEEEPDGNRV